ncbi:MAG TPA: hypothetical protein VKH15_03275 [Candidatus Acidoferrum sp.]|nr:hypothetical protein [Candidatus Acidoferrum sp.]
MRRFLIAIVSLAVLPAIGQAQGRGGGMMGAHAAFSAPAPHAVAHSAPSAATHATSASHAYTGSHYVRTRSGAVVARAPRTTAAPVRSTGPTRRILSQDIAVPGLGFDYTHFAGTHPGNSNRNRNGQFVGAYFPFFGGGYYTPLFPDDADEAPAAEGQQADNGEPDTGQYPGRSRYDDSQQNYPAQTYEPAPESRAQRESEEYVFVRRDGTVFFAVAYAWENSTLRYVTNEGVRHLLTSDKLDLDATKQFNEQRGLDFRTPVPTA